MASNNLKWPQMALIELKWPQTTTNELKWPQMTSKNLKWPEITSNYSKWIYDTKFNFLKKFAWSPCISAGVTHVHHHLELFYNMQLCCLLCFAPTKMKQRRRVTENVGSHDNCHHEEICAQMLQFQAKQFH